MPSKTFKTRLVLDGFLSSDSCVFVAETPSMILRFSLENWMSFQNKAEFTMLAGRERQHGERVPRLLKYQARIVPIAALYGGNASGKTSFFKALAFAKLFVVNGSATDSRIPVEPFRLDISSIGQPSRFSFEILVEETVYDFSFSVTDRSVLEEKLAIVTRSQEKVLYARRGGKIHFDSSLEKDLFLHFAFQGTRDNQLFLTNSVSQKVENFRPVYDWFKKTLVLVAPDTRFAPFERFLDEGNPLYTAMNAILPLLDTGITHIGGEEIPFESLSLPDTIKQDLEKELKEGMTVRIMDESVRNRLVCTRKNERLIIKKLMTCHQTSEGKDALFEMFQESDGSQRVIDLLPAFLELASKKSKKVYVIDEIDRSLHTLLTRKLIELFLERCSTETRSQLLLTTHDVLLMDQSLLRRDEIWVTERQSNGESKLIPFSAFKEVRYDKDIRKSYLQGRMGGVPFLSPITLDASSRNNKKRK